jgi:hypothetical protein
MLNMGRILDITETSKSIEVNTTLKGAHITIPEISKVPNMKEFDNKPDELKSLKHAQANCRKC